MSCSRPCSFPSLQAVFYLPVQFELHLGWSSAPRQIFFGASRTLCPGQEMTLATRLSA